MEIVSDYMRDDTLRHALNELTRKTFGFDFENWVSEGYFEGDYIPYSFIEDGKIVSNVSANRMRFLQNGSNRNYIQIGTVMTEETYRRQGLAGKLIECVVKRYSDEYDGIYLFGNLYAAEFYRKKKFAEGIQYRYSVKNEYCGKNKSGDRFLPVDESDSVIKQKYKDTVRRSAVNSSLEQLNKYSLVMFCTADMKNVYYAGDIDCFIVAEAEGSSLLIKSIICDGKKGLADILQRTGRKYDSFRLGFVPCMDDMETCVAEAYDGGDDYRLFYLGRELGSIEKEKLYFPELSYA